MLNIIRTLLLCCLTMSSLTVSASPLNVATSDWVPYVGKDLPEQGLAIDIVTTALKRAGYQPAVTIQTWSRTLEGVDVGVFDLIAAAWHSPDREKHYAFSKPYLFNEIKLVKRADSTFKFNSLADLNDRLIGIIPGYAYGNEIDEAQGLLRVPGTHVLQNMLRVLNGDIELTLDDERVLKHEIRHNMSANQDKLILLPKAVSRNGLHIAVSKQNPRHNEIVRAFDKAILDMKNDGEFDRLVAAHAND